LDAHAQRRPASVAELWYTTGVMFGSLGFGEILVICVVLIIVVGPERLPSMMKQVGKAVRTVRQASRDIQATVGLDELMREDVTYVAPVPPAPPPAETISQAPSPSTASANVPLPVAMPLPSTATGTTATATATTPTNTSEASATPAEAGTAAAASTNEEKSAPGGGQGHS
jgi:sec-independent protein translocase protein TatB